MQTKNQNDELGGQTPWLIKYSAGSQSLLMGILLTLSVCGIAQAGTFGVLTYEIIGEEITITDCERTATGSLVIPEAIEGKPVTAIGDRAFFDCSALTDITLSSGIAHLGDWAFQYCEGLLSVHVAAGNLHYTSIDDVLFNADQTEIIVYPVLKPELTYSIPASVTRIGDYAFCHCRWVQEITIPSGVTTVGSSMFIGCRSLTNISIPASVTSIRGSAFRFCTALPYIIIPASVTYIDRGAFLYCSGLLSIDVVAGNSEYTSLDGVLFNEDQTELIKCPEGKPGSYSIPSSVTTISSSAFSYCKSLISITIPSSVTTIGGGAFSYCKSLARIDIPASVTSMGSSMFQNCTSVTRISIPSGITDFGFAMFRNCSALTRIELPPSITSIGNDAFSGCSSLNNFPISASITSISSSAFRNCSGLLSIDVAEENLHYKSVDGVLFNVDQTELITYPAGKPGVVYPVPSAVSLIGDYAFYNANSLTNIILPSGVSSIGFSAFSGCSSLAKITIPAGVTSIDDYTFSDCSSLVSIAIPVGIVHIGNSVFSRCSRLLSITVDAENPNYSSTAGVLYNADQTELIVYPGGKPGAYSLPASVTSIGGGAFNGCVELTDITVPAWYNGITFRGCSRLESIAVAAGHPKYTSIDGVVFSMDQTELVRYPEGKPGSYTVPDGVTHIRAFAFNECNSLSGITFPTSLTHIGQGAFRGNRALSNIIIPSGATCGVGAFVGCPGLLSIGVEAGNSQYTSVDGVLFNTNQTELVAYPAGQSGDYSIPDGVTDFGQFAFFDCGSLSNITFPSSIANIDDHTFSDCTNLKSASFSGNAPPAFGRDVFDKVDSGFMIHYLSGNTGFTSPVWRGYPVTSWFMDEGVDPAADLDQDVNGDGVTLLVAYALNLDPSLDLSGSLPQAEMTVDAMGMIYYAASPSITYTAETSTNLETWTETGVSLSELDPQNRRTATVDLTVPHRFLRLRVEM